MIRQCAQVILVEVRCGCVIVQGNDSVLNHLREWLREQYQKHQPVGVEVEVKVKTNQTNQLIESTINKPIQPSINQSCARLPAKPDKQLLGEAEDNRERLCKRANGQNNSYEQTTKNHWPIKRSRSSNSSESNRIAIKQAIYPRAVRSWSADRTIDPTIGRTWVRVQAPPLRSELVRVLDQGLKIWNRPGAWS